MKNPNIKTKVQHSMLDYRWEVIGTSLGKKHLIAVLPYYCESEYMKEEALKHAEFISYCFNNSDTICHE